MPVYVLKTIMPMSEFRKWMIFLRDDQPDIPEIQMAQLTAMVSQGLGGKGKPKDYIIRKEQPKINPKGVSESQVRGALGMFTKKSS